MGGGFNEKRNRLSSLLLNDLTKQYEELEKVTKIPKYLISWLEGQNNIMGLWNQKGLLIYVSDFIEQVLGYKPKELKKKGWLNITSTDDLISIREKFFVHTAQNIFEIKTYNKKGEEVLFDCVFEEIQKNERKKYYLGIFKLKELPKEQNERIVQSEKMNVAGQLAAGIAHEIRNPLTSLKGFLQLLQAGVSQKEIYYKIMNDELEKIEAITSELLFISKPLTNERSLQSVHAMMNDVLVLLNSHAHIRNITIVKNEENEYFLYCDPSQIKQVLINLIKNAIEATEENGKIMIHITSDHAHVKIDIIDEGPGIPEHLLDKIGEPFFTTKENGTGLGLMITKYILEKYNAELIIFNNPDKGCTFRIVIPKEHQEIKNTKR